MLFPALSSCNFDSLKTPGLIWLVFWTRQEFSWKSRWHQMVAEMRLTRLRAVAYSRMSEIPSAARFFDHQGFPFLTWTSKNPKVFSGTYRCNNQISDKFVTSYKAQGSHHLITFQMPGQLILKVTTQLKIHHFFWSPLVDMSIVAVLWKFCGETFPFQNRLKQELNAAGASVPSEKRRPFQSALHFHSKQSLTRSWPNPQRFKKRKVVTDFDSVRF